MDYAPHVDRIVKQAERPLPVSDIFARLVEATGSVPSLDELNDALGRTGQGQISVESYVEAIEDFIPAVQAGQAAAKRSWLRRGLLVAIRAVVPLLLLGVVALQKNIYHVAAFTIGYALLFVFAVLFPGSRLTALLVWHVGIRQKPNESGPRFQLRSGSLVLLLGSLLLGAAIWGRSALYESGVARGDQPLLEIMLMIPMPLLGVTLLLWGLGKVLKGVVGIASGEGRAVSRSDTATGATSGKCPNCALVIPIDSVECPRCRAVFGEGSTWRVRPL